MGNCECVPASNFQLGTNGEPQMTEKIKVVKIDEQKVLGEASLITFSEISFRSIESSRTASSFFNIANGNMQKLNSSKVLSSSKVFTCKSYNSLLAEDKQNCENVKVQVFEKISIKQLYDLKKMIQKVRQTLVQLDIPQTYLECQLADPNKLYQKGFVKLQIKNQEGQFICYYRGSITVKNQVKMLQGVGELYFANGAYYNGNIKNNSFNGLGIYIHPDKDFYYGNWNKDSANGYGQFRHYEGVVSKGEWLEDQQHGIGEEYWPDGAIFRGYFSKGLKKSGRFSWPNKSYYEGQFKNNKFEGKGVFVWEDGRSYQGSWKGNMMDGWGVFKWMNGQVYSGEYQQDKKHGKGQLTLCDGTLVRGKFVKGKLDGMSQIDKDGVIRKVRWRDGVEVKM